ncbi:hypothetical protein KFU94_33270 [Chloroflexi bacterium TSY]|nr:hypothetical protein [Chloroflexi bacterium TSY]
MISDSMKIATRESVFDINEQHVNWHGRHRGLERAIERLKGRIREELNGRSKDGEPDSETSTYSRATDPYAFETDQIVRLEMLVENLDQITDNIYSNLVGAFTSTNPFGPPLNHSFNDILYALSKKLMTDLMGIQQAFMQRQNSGLPRTWMETRQEQSDTLYLADIMANQALQYAKDKNVVAKDVFAITYFQRRIEIRILPYANMLLIGLPYATQCFEHHDKGLDPSLDLLALPHEIGHYLYWYGTISDRGEKIHEVIDLALKKEGIETGDWRRAWLEELFADLYSCLVAGPINVFGFQDMLSARSTEYFSCASLTHPDAKLRPLLQSKILRHIRNNKGESLYIDTPNYLDQLWLQMNTVEDDLLGSQSRLAIPAQMNGERRRLSYQKALEQLDDVIQIILDTIPQLQPQKSTELWSREVTTNNVATNLVWTGRFVGDQSKRVVELIDERYLKEWGTDWCLSIFGHMFRCMMYEPEDCLKYFFLPSLPGVDNDKADNDKVEQGANITPKSLHPLIVEQILITASKQKSDPTQGTDWTKELWKRWNSWDKSGRQELLDRADTYRIENARKEIELSGREIQETFEPLIQAAYDFWQPYLKQIGRKQARKLWIDYFSKKLHWEFSSHQIDFFAKSIQKPGDSQETLSFLEDAKEFAHTVERYRIDYQNRKAPKKIVIDEWAEKLVFVKGWSTDGPTEVDDDGS